MPLLLIFFFVVGLTVGSFLNVVIMRGARGEKPYGRSRCNSCKKILSPLELIPILSFALQKGRCRSCGTVLSWQYPLVELGTAVLFSVSFWYFSTLFPLDARFFLQILGVYIMISAGIVILVSDLRWQIIPDGAVLILLIYSVVVLFFRYFLSSGEIQSLLPDLAAAVSFSLFFALLWFFSGGRWMGLGDAKLMFPLSLILGFPYSLLAFLFSFWIGGAVGIFLIVLRLKTLSSRIPFGPFILIGSVIAYFFGGSLIHSSGFYLLL